MKRLAWILMLCAAGLFAQEAAEKKPEEAKSAEHAKGEEGKAGEGEKHEEDFTMWKWANFAILAGLGIWGIGKSAPAFFKGRTDAIQKDMEESARVAADAEARAKAVETKISQLSSELERMNAETKADMARENARLQGETTKAIERIAQRGEQEVEAAAKVARLELKQYAAQLAVDLAEQRIRARLTPDTQAKLVEDFVHDLGADSRKN
ncbi:MAG: ATP synthase F0 subunit B [Bryobacteraceae bacterium]